MMTIGLQKLRKLGMARNQSGFTLIEGLIATALLVTVGAAVLMGVSTSFKASAITDKQSTALAFAQSQIDYIQSQTYEDDGSYTRIDDVSRGADQQVLIPYTMTVTTVSIDAGLQQITVVVYQANDTKPVTLRAYKVNPTKVTP